MQTFYVMECVPAQGWRVTPVQMRKPYTEDAKRFARVFVDTYPRLGISGCARELGMPEKTLRSWIKEKNEKRRE